jgi:hypothetical protein
MPISPIVIGVTGTSSSPRQASRFAAAAPLTCLCDIPDETGT